MGCCRRFESRKQSTPYGFPTSLHNHPHLPFMREGESWYWYRCGFDPDEFQIIIQIWGVQLEKKIRVRDIDGIRSALRTTLRSSRWAFAERMQVKLSAEAWREIPLKNVCHAALNLTDLPASRRNAVPVRELLHLVPFADGVFTREQHFCEVHLNGSFCGIDKSFRLFTVMNCVQ